MGNIKAIKMLELPLYIGLDYIDLYGNYGAVTLEASNENDAIECLRNAWNAKLLWHFNLHLKNAKPICRTRQIPFATNLLSQVLALQRILVAIEKSEAHFILCQNQIISHYATTEHRDHHKIVELGNAHSQLNALKAAYENHAADLKSKGLNPPSSATKNQLEIIDCVSRAAVTLERMKKAKGNFSDLRPMGYIARAITTQFQDGLPKIEGIFSSNGADGLFDEIAEN